MRSSRTLSSARMPADSRLRQALRRNFAGAGGLLLIAAAAALAAALATWSVDDPSWSHATEVPVRNVLGRGGAVVADLVMQLVGLTSAVFLCPVVVWGWNLVAGRSVSIERRRLVAWVLGTLAGAGFAGALPVPTGWPLPTGLGGVLGDLVLQVPAAFSGGLLEGTERIVVGAVFGLLALGLLGHAAGLYGRGAAKGDVDEEEFDEAEDERDGFGAAAAGAISHAWLSAKASLRRRRGAAPDYAYPGEESLADDYGEPAPVPQRRGGLARLVRGLVQPDDGLDGLVAPPREPRLGRAAPAPEVAPQRGAAPVQLGSDGGLDRRARGGSVHADYAPRRQRVAEDHAGPQPHAEPADHPYDPGHDPRFEAPARRADAAPGHAPAHAHGAGQAPRLAPRPAVPVDAYDLDDDLETIATVRPATRAVVEPAGRPEPVPPRPRPLRGPAALPRGPKPEARREPALEPAAEPRIDDEDLDAPTTPPWEQTAARAPLHHDLDADYDEEDDFEAEHEARFSPPRPVEVVPPPRPLRGPAAAPRQPAPAAEPMVGRITPPAPPPRPGKRIEADRQPSLPAVGGQGWQFPPLQLLAEPRPQGQVRMSADALEQNARLLEGVLEDFGVKGEIINVRPGPVVTLYELEPAPGIKSSRVIGLADDIARSMSAIAARVAVIPGKNAIGIELPNQRRETVYLRELVASQDFERSKARLALCLGKTIGGEPVIVDLARTPHMLVAGTTGSGKSVSINTMILSLLYRLTPEQCRLIMIDPKMLELSVYDGIPHLLTPVVTDPKKAVVALKWTVREMEDRYKKMSKLGVRNIEGFNARVAQALEKGESISRTVQTGFDRETGEPIFETEEFDLAAMPFIVVIIDEMADLMMVAGKEIEGTVQRLAQMARAAGIHVIMATQRPSVDVITGTIKANFPTRVSFQVTSRIDSRTILGEQGAEQLLGQGDMLYMAGGGRIQRVHGPFVSDDEVEHIVAHLKTQGTPDYLDDITAEEDESPYDDGVAGGGGGEGGEGADLYDQAIAVVLRDKKVSTSYVQRRLGIGYNRAASIIERMEKEGIVSAPNSQGKREILLERPVGGGYEDDY